MAITGSYNYPGMYNNITAGTVNEQNFRSITSKPPALNTIARLFASGSGATQNLFFIDELGTTRSIGGGSISGDTLNITGDGVISGNLSVGGQIYDLDSNLILSSAIGSIIAASGSLDFPNGDKRYHIRAVNNHLILSSSAGSTVAISGTALKFAAGSAGNHRIEPTGNDFYFFRGPNSTTDWAHVDVADIYCRANGGTSANITASPGGKTLSLGVSTVLQWMSTDADNTWAVRTKISQAGPGHLFISGGLDRNGEGRLSVSELTSMSGNLILSSSVGSVVTVSSSLEFPNVHQASHITARNGHLILSSSNGSRVFVSGSLSVGTNNTMFAGFFDSSLVAGTGQVRANNYLVGSPNNLAMTVNNDGQLRIQRFNAQANYGFIFDINVSGTLKLRNREDTTDLVIGVGALSSSTSIVTMSGAFKLGEFAQSALPAGTDKLSGSIVWVSDLKTPAIYGHQGWSRILTGSL
jgi:hypothetical protein